jgi:hypothetical protein
LGAAVSAGGRSDTIAAATASASSCSTPSLFFGTVEILALALRAIRWTSSAERQLPLMLAITTRECSLFSHLYYSSFNP